jgi:hypothetical protein
MAISEPLRLPAGAEFSPGQIELRELLELAGTHKGDRAALREAIRERWFSDAAPKLAHDPAARLEQQLKRAGNVVIGLKNYGLYDSKTRALAPLGEQLRATASDDEMHELLARHILLNLHGDLVMKAIRSLKKRDIKPTKLNLMSQLRQDGLTLPPATTHHTVLLDWLEEAGVVSRTSKQAIPSEIDEAVLEKIIGGSSGVIHEVISLPKAQRAYLDTVHCLVTGRGVSEVETRQVDALAVETYGDIFGPEDRRKASIRDPLVERGWIEVAGTGGGRGGKSGTIKPTQKLLKLDPELFRRPATLGLPPDVTDQLDTPLVKIYENLSSDDTHVKGLALELLAVNMAYDLGLQPVAFRLRAEETTGRTEVDLMAEGVGRQFSRWVFQCKNTASVDVKVVAREIGLADILHAHVAVIVTTGKFTRDTPAVRAALARATEKQVVLVDGKTIEKYKSDPKSLVEYFNARSVETMETKRPQGLTLIDEFKA